MKDTFTYDEIMQAEQAGNMLASIRIGNKSAYRLAKLINKLRSCRKDIDKLRLELYKKWGTEKTAGKGDYTVKDEQQVPFMENLDKLMGQTMEVDFHPIACNMFPELPAAAVVGMGKFMIEEEKILIPGQN